MMLTTTPKMTRVISPSGRHYQVEGHDEPFSSVTTARNMALEKVKKILYEHLEGGSPVIDSLWVDAIIEQARHRPDQVRGEAADFGTHTHMLIDDTIQGLESEIPPEIEPVVDNLAAWRREVGGSI